MCKKKRKRKRKKKSNFNHKPGEPKEREKCNRQKYTQKLKWSQNANQINNNNKSRLFKITVF